MSRRIVQVYYGSGKGKTSAAVGQCIRAAGLGQSVIIIQFLKGKDAEEFSFLNRLEPDIKLFRFERENESYDCLLDSQKKEERQNILNGFNFAKKIISIEDIISLITLRDDYCKLVMTGRCLPPELEPYVDIVSKIDLEKDLEM